MLSKYIFDVFKNSLQKLGVENFDQLFFEIPKNPDYGDLSTNIALRLAKQLKNSPLKIADSIITNIDKSQYFISDLTIAAPGFINIKFSNDIYFKLLKNLWDKADNIGRQDTFKGKTANVEYVSVNPTGLLHLGHGRNACIGDTVANLLEWLGYSVTREYYFNNAGNQMNMLAKSIYARYMQLFDKDFPFPDDGYHGDYIKQIANELFDDYAEQLKDYNDENHLIIRKFGEKWCFARIKATLNRLGIEQDLFYNEDSLYSTGKIKQLIEELEQKNLTYKKDNAVWMKFTDLGLSDDRVIVKSTGEPTYRLPDIAYHREKFLRNFDLIVDVFGADHIATIPDVLAAETALGFNTDKVKVLIHQFVTLTENGEQVKMSKRTGKNYTLDDLLDEVGNDVVRFFLIMRGISTHLEFDLSLAREQSDKNPVFYLQYAHARIASVIDNAKEAGLSLAAETETPDFSLLTSKYELDLIKELLEFENAIHDAGTKYEPQFLAEYLRSLASAFHIFYHNCRIIGSEPTLQKSRLALAFITKNAIKNGLSILGISAPERM